MIKEINMIADQEIVKEVDMMIENIIIEIEEVTLGLHLEHPLGL